MKPRLVPAPPSWHADFQSVGVTGTNGKTTTTAWVARALGALGRGPVARATTVGFFLDDRELPIEKSYDGFIEGMRTAHAHGSRLAAIELTSEALAHGFAKAWPCSVGVFTNLTHDHLDAHGSPEHYLASKAQLFVSLGPGATAVLNAADPTCELLREVIGDAVTVRSYAVGARGPAAGTPDIVATDVTVSWEGTRVVCALRPETFPGMPETLTVRVPAIGEVYAENALAALLGAFAVGVPLDRGRDALAEASAPPGRFEVVGEKPYVVVDYAHSPDALGRTVAAARRLTPPGGRLWVVFGAGGKRDKDKRGPMGEAARPADVVILTTDNPRHEDPAAIAQAIAIGLSGHPDVRTVLDRRAAIAGAIAAAGTDDVVLVAGKGHETEQTIGDVTGHFSDVVVAKEALAARPT